MTHMDDYDAAHATTPTTLKTPATADREKNTNRHRANDFIGVWQTANLFESLANYSQYFADPSVGWIGEHSDNGAILKSLTDPTVAKFNWYNDDAGWWALAWIRQAKALPKTDPRRQQYLNNAQSVFARLTKSWGKTRCGGVTWTSRNGVGRPNRYVNSITNELFLHIATSLANVNGQTIAPNVSSHNLPAPNDYAGWAWQSAQWWLAGQGSVLLKPATNGVRDGLDPGKSCAVVGSEYSYNQGVILGGLAGYAALSSRSGRDDLVPLRTVAQLIRQLAGSNFVSASNGVIVEPHASSGATPGNSDHATFKGVLARYLGYSYISMVANTDRVAGAAEAASAIRNVLEASSRAAVDHAVNPHPAGKMASTPAMGYDWASSNNDSLIYYQAALAGSVLDLLNAAYLVSNVPDLKTA